MNWFSKPKNTPLGTSLSSLDGVKAEIGKMQGSIVKTSKSYTENIKKYKEIAKLNEQLTKSYIANLKVIVDVSELLNSYSTVFKSLKDEFSKMEAALGKPLDITDFEYLSNLTKDKIETLNLEFMKQSDNLKKMYSQYGKPEELDRVLMAQSNVQKVINSASDTYKAIENQSSDENTWFGGKKVSKAGKKKTHLKSKKVKTNKKKNA